jgi:hypothetical protein
VPEFLLAVIGVAAGALGCWLWLARRMHERLESEMAESARKAARAVDWAKSEAAMQIDRRDQEIAVLRARSEEHDHSIEQIRARLQADLALAQRERAQWESQASEASTRVAHLTGQLQSIKDEGLRDLEQLRSLARSLQGVANDYVAVLETMEARLGRPASTEDSSRRTTGRPPGDVLLPTPVPRPR